MKKKRGTFAPQNIYLCLLSLVLILFFQNCAPLKPTTIQMQSLASKGTMFSGSCEAEMMNLYQTTYYPIFRNNCANCHTNGPGVGAFAHPTFQTAYNSFRSMTRDRVERNLVNPSHQAPYTGAQHQASVDQFRPSWIQAEAAAVICNSAPTTSGTGTPPPGTPSAGADVFTLHKSNSRIIPAATNPNTWTRIEWDLQTEMANTTLNNKLQMVIGIEARVLVNNAVQQGYEFRNPTLRLKTGVTGPFRVRGLHLSINDKVLTDITNYEFLDVSVNSTTDIMLAPGAAYSLAVMSPIAVTDRFALSIGSISNSTGGVVVGETPPPTNPTNPLPARVTFTELLSADSRLGVFRVSCNGCHGATNPSAGLNLTNYTAARAAATEIVNRMKDQARPMPSAGLLTQDPRDIVRIWVESGTPQ